MYGCPPAKSMGQPIRDEAGCGIRKPVRETLALKLVLTPILIAAASAVGKRWGPSLSGWLVGLPLTSGPVIFFLALEHGTGFAAAAARGVVLGVTSQAVFGLAYIHLGAARGWPRAIIAGTVAYAAVTAVFVVAPLSPWLEPLIVAASLVLAISLSAPSASSATSPAAAELADLPLRMVIATALVVALTETAPLLGPRLSGLLSPFPIYAAILAAFAHRRGGAQSGRLVWRGLFFGLFAFLGFFSAIAATIIPFGIGVSFALAVVTALLIQGVTLLLLSRLEVPAAEAPVGQPEHRQ